MTRLKRTPSAAVGAVLVVVLALAALLSGLLPLSFRFGVAAGGVLETGQVSVLRWWLGSGLALMALAVFSWRWSFPARAYWFVLLAIAIICAIGVFSWRAAVVEPGAQQEGAYSDPSVAYNRPVAHAAKLRVGIVSSLPLFWPEGVDVHDIVRGGRGRDDPAPFMSHPAAAIDYVDAAALAKVDAVLLVQPRLLQPEELVALDHWIRAGGRALILTDPLLLWPTQLPPGDPRRPPLTSLLDPLLAHWGLRLEPSDMRGGGDGKAVRRVRLGSGHMLITAGASAFAVTGASDNQAHCDLVERGLMALCRIGRGQARLVADADWINNALWLVDAGYPFREEAWAADIPTLVDGWLIGPLAAPSAVAPRRVVDEAALLTAMRWAILSILIWAGMGWAGFKPVFRMGEAGKVRKGENEKRTNRNELDGGGTENQ